jgi:uncharacterized membrane protein
MDCPFCAEDIKDNASVCRHCGRDLLAIRPLLDQVQAQDKRLDALEADLAKLAQFVQRVRRRHDKSVDGELPSLTPLGAIIFGVWALFITSFFFELVWFARGRDRLPPEIPALAFFVVTFAVGFLCDSARQRPMATDIIVGAVITVLSVIARHFAWIALRPKEGFLPADPGIWYGLGLLAVSTFLSFSAGGFVRYLVRARISDKPPATYATDLSRFLVRRHLIDAAAVDTRMKSIESMLHSVGAIAATIGALAGTWGAIERLKPQNANPPPALSAPAPAPATPQTPK